MKTIKLETTLIRGRWWIVGDPVAGPMGPYEDTEEGRAEAKSTCRRVEKFNRNWDKPGFVTSDKPKEK